MLIIIDKKIPEEAKHKLKTFGELLELETSGITYDAISGHPDIFFSQLLGQLVVAPNLPSVYFEKLEQAGIRYIKGEDMVGAKYPQSSAYNSVINDKYIIHNFRNTEFLVTSIAKDLDLIHVDQSYTRCNLIPLGCEQFITSDKGIQKTLKRFDLDVLFVDPRGILLPGFSHGFFGGCVGIHKNIFMIIGSLDELDNRDEVISFINKNGYEILELYDGPLFDGGSILFL